MKTRYYGIVPALLMMTAAVAGHAQTATEGNTGHFYKGHNADVGVAATGQYTTSITDQTVQLSGAGAGDTEPHQTTSDSPGVLFTLRDNPFSWAGVEFNYQYTKLSERFFVTAPGQPTGAANTPVNVTTSFHEATGAYLFRVKLHKVKPYVGIGGGALAFEPPTQFHHQWRGTGLVDIGLDMQTHSRLGFRIGARDLVYRAPNYSNSGLSSSRWVSTEEPYAGVYVKF